jgi:hypothetical protein
MDAYMNQHKLDAVLFPATPGGAAQDGLSQRYGVGTSSRGPTSDP